MLRLTKLHIDSHRAMYGSYQYGQANSRFLMSSLFWLDTPNIHFIFYLHTTSLINSMQSGFPNLYPYKQTNVETDLYLICVVSFVIFIFAWHFLTYAFLIYCSPLIKASPLIKLFLFMWSKPLIEISPISSTHVSIAMCQICLLSHDAMISHNIEAISLIPFALLSFAWTRLFLWSFNTIIHNLAFISTLCGISSSLLYNP